MMIKKIGVYILLSVGFIACGDQPKPEMERLHPYQIIQGEAQGTTYSITFLDSEENLEQEVDSILDLFDQHFSAWRSGSLINRINDFTRRDTVFAFIDTTKYMGILWELSKEVHRKTDGAFDPTVFPLVKAWGFFKDDPEEMSQEKIDSILEYTGFIQGNIDLIERMDSSGYIYEESWVRKAYPKTKLDFNAIAQGYSVDIISDFLEEEKGVTNYMVEIGGEVRVKGYNPDGEQWRIGVEQPKDINSNRDLESVITLSNCAVVTSGSYRKFYEKDGKRYSHTIDPRTGYPVDHNLLSATVVADRAAMADAYATAFMVMGLDATVDYISSGMAEGMEVYLIFDNGGKYESVMTEGMQKMISYPGLEQAQ